MMCQNSIKVCDKTHKYRGREIHSPARLGEASANNVGTSTKPRGTSLLGD